MKNFLKACKKNKFTIILFFVFLVALVVRLYNFENRFTFGPEQARSLFVSAKYITDKPSLLGQEYFRVNSAGHKLFTSAIFNYTLVPLLLIFKYNPVPISYYFAFLNIFTALVLYILSKKMFGKNIALFSLILFLFNSYMIYHSMFIWVLNYMPLIGVLSFYYVWKIYKKKSTKLDLFFLGALSGLGVGFEYLYLLAVLIVIFVLIKYSKHKIQDFVIFTLGGLVGDFTQVLFDVRHDFYHLNTLWQYALDTFKGVSDAGFVYYHFLHFWPVFTLIGGMLLWLLYKKNKFISIFVLTLYLFINLNSSLISMDRPVGMPGGLVYKDLLHTSQIISNEAEGNFNLVTLYDFDTRGYVLRYLVEFVYGKTPLGDIDYPSSEKVFALAKDDYDFDGNVPWEIKTVKPFVVVGLEKIGEGYKLYRIDKNLK